MENEIKITDPAQGTDYYSLNKMSFSRLKAFKQSPRHYLHSLTPHETTPAMIFGSAFHCFVLENETFSDNYFVMDWTKRPELDKGPTSKINQAWKHSLAGNGKQEISQDDMEKIFRMAERLNTEPFARELLDQVTEVEKALFWTDPETGLEMKLKIDNLARDFSLDLKTTENAKPETFARTAFNMDYHSQAAIYQDGRAANKMEKGDFYFIAIEKTAPYGISVNKAARDFINYGRTEYSNTLQDFRYWLEMGSPNVCYAWRKPLGYSLLNLPSWIR